MSTRQPWTALVALALPGCLFLADAPTSIKRLEDVPSVALVSHADGEVVGGSVELVGEVHSELAHSGQLAIDGEDVDNKRDGALAYAWDTHQVASGEHAISVRSRDEVGRESEVTVTLVVDQLPTVSISNPGDGDTVGGLTAVSVNASDPEGLDRVELLVGGEVLATDLGGPWVFTLDTCDLDSGPVTLEVEAVDDQEQRAAASVGVVVEQEIIAELQDTSTYAEPTTRLQVEAAWDEGLVEVRFQVQGETIASFDSPTEGYQCTQGCWTRCTTYTHQWDTTGLAEARYLVEVEVEDASGRIAFDSHWFQVEHDVDGDGYDHVGYGGTDCDDRTSSTHPDAAEICDDVDQDCDGQVDEDFDLDLDGFAGGEDCDPGAAWFDCDDQVAEVNPDAEEVCGDGVDNDCDGPDDACLLDGEHFVGDLDEAWFDGGSGGDYFGLSGGWAGDVDGDGSDDLLVASAEMGSGDRGMAYLFKGVPSGENLLVDAVASLAGYSSDDAFGQAVASLGDLDGDGYGDVAIAEPFNSYGRVYVFQGPLTGELTYADADDVLTPRNGYPSFGTDIAAGDVDGDGDVDLVAGSFHDGTQYNVTYWEGPVDYSGNSPDANLHDGRGGGGGYSVAVAPDVDGDGLPDVLIGAPLDATTATDAGAVYLITDTPDGNVYFVDAEEALIKGSTVEDTAGACVSGAGDTDGDGYGDVLIGGPFATSYDGGKAWLFSGPVRGNLSVTAADASFRGGPDALVGWDLASDVDFDGDGNADVVLAAPGEDDGYDVAGAVYVMYGPVSGSYSMSVDLDVAIYGESPNDELGILATGVPDIDGDGADELLLGAPGMASGAGRAYLVLGRTGY